MNKPRRNGLLGFLILTAGGAPALGQWVEQSFDLQVGWNSVFLEVDPMPADADTLFANTPVEAVWLRISGPPVGSPPPDCTSADDPNCREREDTLWRSWVPRLDGACDTVSNLCVGGANPGSACSTDDDCLGDAQSDPLRLARNLPTIRGGQAFLIKASAPTTLNFRGKPNGRKTRWSRGYNLQGFHVDPSGPPTFEAYLSPSSAHGNTRIFDIELDGDLAEVADPSNATVDPGVGYWVKADRNVVYDGPIAIDNASLRGVELGKKQTQHALTVDNLSPDPRTVTIRYVPSEDAPAGRPTVASNSATQEWLIWLDKRSGEICLPGEACPEGDTLVWLGLSTEPWVRSLGIPGKFLGLGSGELVTPRQVLELGCDRFAAAEFAVLDPEAPDGGSRFQGILELKDDAGYRRWIAVSMERPTQAGLWVGSVAVDRVEWVTRNSRTWLNPSDVVGCACEGGFCSAGPNQGSSCRNHGECACPDTDLMDGSDDGGGAIRPVSTTFVFPIIMHVDDQNNVKMLTEITMLKKPADPVSGAATRMVLATPACPPAFCNSLEAGGSIDGQDFSPRISTAAFAFDGDLPMSGDLSSVITGVSELEPSHRLNPFKHLFHPDHDCTKVGECFKVIRKFTFNFVAEQRDGNLDPGFGFSFLNGDYREDLTISSRTLAPNCGCFEIGGTECVGGLMDGMSCPQVCVGGPDDGDPCPPSGCGMWCDAGSNNPNTSCTSNDDCTNGLCVGSCTSADCPGECDLDSDNASSFCGNDSACPNGSCVMICAPLKACAGQCDGLSADPGAFCNSDSDCPGGTCGAPTTACTSDDECDCDFVQNLRSFSTTALGRFQLTRVSDIPVLNDGQ